MAHDTWHTARHITKRDIVDVPYNTFSVMATYDVRGYNLNVEIDNLCKTLTLYFDFYF